MEIQTIQKNINSTPRKLRLVADMIRQMKPGVAITNLEFTNKAAASLLAKAIKTVVANAKQQGMALDQLIFKKLEINEGLSPKRMRAGSRGRGNPYKIRTSQIRIVVSDEKGDH